MFPFASELQRFMENMFFAKSKQTTTQVKLNKLFEKTKTKIDPKLEYLISIDDYCTRDARDAIHALMLTCYSLRKGGPNEKICRRVVNYMRERDITKLIVKILESVAKNHEKIACESHEWTCLLIKHLLVTINPIRLNKDIRSDLVKNGIIQSLLDDLDSCDPNTKDPMQQVRILSNIYRLRNLSDPRIDTPSIIPLFRAARAVDILMKFVKVENKMIKIRSLLTLAAIVNEKEGDRLATNGECIETIVDVLVKAADTDDREYKSKVQIDSDTEKTFRVSVRALAEGLNNLSSNDANKKLIIRHGGLPALSMLLVGLPALSMLLGSDTKRTSEKQNAVEALWKMSFLDECKTDI